MDYPTAHRKLEHHQIAVIGGLILAFVIAAVLMFVHPTASLAVFAVALIALLAALVVGAGLRRAERSAARHALAEHACPKCGKVVDHTEQRPDDWHCEACGADFTERGIETA